MNDSDYVSRGEVAESVYQALREPSNSDTWRRIGRAIRETEAADVRENVRGEWEWRYDDENGRPVYGCSFCNGIVGDAENKEYVYCPYCGADMRGKENDETN